MPDRDESLVTLYYVVVGILLLLFIYLAAVGYLTGNYSLEEVGALFAICIGILAMGIKQSKLLDMPEKDDGSKGNTLLDMILKGNDRSGVMPKVKFKPPKIS